MKKRNVRAEILDAAAQAFKQYGYEKTDMRMIAASLNIAVGTLYYYFSSKEDIFLVTLKNRLYDIQPKFELILEKNIEEIDKIVLLSQQVYLLYTDVFNFEDNKLSPEGRYQFWNHAWENVLYDKFSLLFDKVLQKKDFVYDLSFKSRFLNLCAINNVNYFYSDDMDKNEQFLRQVLQQAFVEKKHG
ncbi:TetR/AcrR family transcriptional regulator [Longirhabdus pacifica]|uniref:TetR/AcrR family transcriptional regulator n=1 Tax=Longirhabdus pacifica TaxID=2305227 RepID=UPI00100927C4|nr:TetR/AcrR family transcriptional regulator [Longirhabdus pacifica]